MSEAKEQTVIKMNHKNLQYFMTIKKLTTRQTQWTETLAEYDFIIRHCKEKNNTWADVLNWWSDLIQKEERSEIQLLRTNNKKEVEYNIKNTKVRTIVIKKMKTMTEIRKTQSEDRLVQKWKQKSEKHLIITEEKEIL